MHRDHIEPDREGKSPRLLCTCIKVTCEPLAMPFGHDDEGGGAARYLIFIVDYRVDQALSASASGSLSVKLIGPFG